MTKYTSFTDLKGWQKCRDLAIAVFEALGTMHEGFPEVKNKIADAALEVPTGLAIAQGLRTDKAHIEYLTNSACELSRLDSLLHLATDIGAITEKDLGKVFEEMDDSKKLVYGFRKYFLEKEKNEKKGVKETA